MTHAGAHHRLPEPSGPDTPMAELAVLLDRMRQLRAQLADCGAPLAPVIAETDRAIAYGERLVTLVQEAADRQYA